MDINELYNLVKRASYHTRSSLPEPTIISCLYLKLPVLGEHEVMHRIERRVVIYTAADMENEISGACDVFGKEVKYIIESATEIFKPIFAMNDGEEIQIGKLCSLVDRARIREPLIKVDEDGTYYLDCVEGDKE